MKALFARSAIGLVRDCMVVLAIFIALTGSAMAENKVQTSIKFLSLITGGSAPTSLKVSGKTILLLPFTWTLPRDDPKTFEIYVTPFREQEQGNYLTIEPSIEEQPKNKAKGQRLTINLKQSLLTLRLKVPELPTAGKYDGQIVVFHQGKVVRSATILLSRAKVVKSVKLVIDRPAITVTESPWTLFTGNSPSFTVTIRNESPDWKAKGVYLRLIEVTGPDYANFDQTKNLQLTWNGRATDDLWRSPSPEAVLAGSVRTIAPGQQAIFTGTYRGLAAGTYNIKIGVASADQAKEQKTEVTVTLRIRDSVFWALIVLAVAIVLSYFSTMETLVRALADVPHLKVCVVGEGPMKDAWTTLAADLGLTDRVTFIGQVPDSELPSIYHRFHFFVLPANARSEAFGTVLLEAMASCCS